MSDQTFSWITLHGTETVCYPSPRDAQFIVAMLSPKHLTPFHDDDLAQATREINAITARVSQANSDPKREPSFISFRGKLMLVWASTEHPVGPDSSPQEIAKVLGLDEADYPPTSS
ncbi:hypothetical protein ACFWUW_10705 [Streptomyces sp. NPDC058655]|uniref:hypothetical protein n=1 Tax=Streptomyces sp. NPDC058655 TaxID=3346577 RepID=UPI003668B4C9